MNTVFIFLIGFVAVWLDVVLAGNGYFVLFVAAFVVYLTVLYKWRRAFLGGLLGFAIVDSFCGSFSLAALLPLLLAGSFWRYNGDCTRLSLFWVPLLAGLVPGGLLILFFTGSLGLSISVIMGLMFLLLKALLITLPGALALVYRYDQLAIRLNLTPSTEVQKEALYSVSQ